MGIQGVSFFPVPVSVLFYLPLRVPCYCLDTLMLRSPQLESHSVLNCPVARAVWRVEGMKDRFQRRSKDHSQCSHTIFFFLRTSSALTIPLLFSCSSSGDQRRTCWKQRRYWGVYLRRAHLQFIISHKCSWSCSLHGFLGKIVLIWVSERPDSNGLSSPGSDSLHTAIPESMAKPGVLLVLGDWYQCHWESGSEEKWENIFWGGKKAEDAFLLKAQRLYCEPSEWHLNDIFIVSYVSHKILK